MMGSWATRACLLIFAGVDANCGNEAKVVRASTASSNGRVVEAHDCLFSSERSEAKVWGGEVRMLYGSKLHNKHHTP